MAGGKDFRETFAILWNLKSKLSSYFWAEKRENLATLFAKVQKWTFFVVSLLATLDGNLAQKPDFCVGFHGSNYRRNTRQAKMKRRIFSCFMWADVCYPNCRITISKMLPHSPPPSTHCTQFRLNFHKHFIFQKAQLKKGVDFSVSWQAQFKIKIIFVKNSDIFYSVYTVP